MNRNIWIVVVFALLCVGGYFFWSHQQAAKKEALLSRASAYWESIRINDLVTAYQMEAETIAGTFLPHEVALRRNFDMRLVSYVLGDAVFLDDNSAEIAINGRYTMMEFGGQDFPVGGAKDYWTYMNGNWYHGHPEKGGAGLRKIKSR